MEGRGECPDSVVATGRAELLGWSEVCLLSIAFQTCVPSRWASQSIELSIFSFVPLGNLHEGCLSISLDCFYQDFKIPPEKKIKKKRNQILMWGKYR